MSNGASRAPQEMRMDLAVLPETDCQGLFHFYEKTGIEFQNYFVAN